MRFYLSITTIALIAQATANQHLQHPFNILEPVLTPDLTDIVQEIVDTHQIPGSALAIVHVRRPTEDGSRVTEDVC
ncbi:hypothetical protein EDB83DRAFT_2383100 [Lactarius deliciosus]|nr:hypothetical protein EDB83DRAFT_2383100 [Lactarius deliciosus]